MQQIHLLLPVPPIFERALWYNESRRYIGIYWDCLFDDCIIADGRGEHVGSGRAWKAFIGHTRIAKALSQYHFGTSVTHPDHMFMLDRKMRRAFVMEYAEGDEFLRLQACDGESPVPPPPPRKRPVLTVVGQPEAELAMPMVSKEAIDDIMKMSRGLETAMISWLDAR